ncbi:hypothetical protein DRZ77_02330 [Candidatus Woesearchaeota archaeon]|nr:hypothetical protein [Candidatus Woesearchaeota archaeon]RLE40432.1 MAG: hypothetical protein DRZ77_02330 [Candidatus Woesearchaeota archaeon]RLI68888.1 MAG: hypothetical protein DRO91_08420 [Candidatus Heimdallarchaeota archaeon]
MKYPREVITIGSSGKPEARVLIEQGKYIRYTYLDPKTGKPIAKGKESIWLKSKEGRIEHLFFIPLKKGKGKALVIRKEESPKERKIWDNKKKKAIDLF